MLVQRLSRSSMLVGALLLEGFMLASPTQAQPAYKVYGEVISFDTLLKKNQDKFYRLESEKYQLIDSMAKQDYIDAYWAKKAKEQKISPQAAQEKYMASHVKFTDKEVKETLEKYKDHPRLKELSKKEQEEQVRNLLQMRGEQEIIQAIIDAGVKSGELAVLYPRPAEPIYNVEVSKDDHMRFGPNVEDVKPVSPACSTTSCPITVIEYSEYQCPFCARVVPTTKRLLNDYKGKIRWIVRDFPLNFHDRARPAAIAAKCAGQQGEQKYWQMYEILFENQANLSDKDIAGYAEKIALDKKKFDQCLAQPQQVDAVIESHLKTGSELGVSGTPAFFINGRRLSGALPYEEFKRVIDDELAAKAAK